MKYGNKHHSNLEQARDNRVRQSNAHTIPMEVLSHQVFGNVLPTNAYFSSIIFILGRSLVT